MSLLKSKARPSFTSTYGPFEKKVSFELTSEGIPVMAIATVIGEVTAEWIISN